MSSQDIRLPVKHQAVLERFLAACQADERILAAFLGGSYARDTADPHSDLDLYLITTDEGFTDLRARRDLFVRQLGEPIFMEDFDNPDVIFYILADGTEGEIGFGQASRFDHIHAGPYRVLLDKVGILTGAIFPPHAADLVEQLEKLRRLMTWFWHDLSHFITAMSRRQLWWAQGELEILRGCCVSLARLQNDFSDADIGDEVYFKLEKAMPVEQLATLQTSFCPMDADTMLQSVWVIVRSYKELAVPLATAHGLSYPEALEGVMLPRLEDLQYRI